MMSAESQISGHSAQHKRSQHILEANPKHDSLVTKGEEDTSESKV